MGNLNTELENAAKKAEEEARKTKEAEEAEEKKAKSTELATPEQLAETAEEQSNTAEETTEETAKEAEKEEKPEEKKKEPVRLKHLSDLDLAGISIRDETVQKLLNLQDYYDKLNHALNSLFLLSFRVLCFLRAKQHNQKYCCQ